MMQCVEESVDVTVYILILVELWLKLKTYQLVGLLATSIKQHATGSKGEPNVIMPEEAWRKLVLHGLHPSILHAHGGASFKHMCLYKA